ncbi:MULTISPECIES: hypothetical protein [Shewanella]|uniref:hypothetical protein n=1 Tax=Shewanella TaxID=22 RepID=UPI001C65B357|nr:MULTISPECIES: hypothetical protein [Shewanella]QYJ77065.1 hypothetical protein K0H79_09025 [Shewanella sp. FJAT-52076]QYK06983.1 hypothetical protein K0H63_09400 [Shewanella zhangzhouensis]
MQASTVMLQIHHRLEPGCLGPDGVNHVEAFCRLAQEAMKQVSPGICRWQLEPRYDKRLAEMSYFLGAKQLTREQAGKYLQLFGEDIDSFEERFHDKLTQLIHQYLARKP